MTIRTHVPWPLRIAVGLLALAAAAAIGTWWASGRTAGLQRDIDRAELQRLGEQNRILRAERDRLAEAANTSDSRRVMERSTVKEMSDQIERLETENARLTEDVAFFDAATGDRKSQAATRGGIAIRRFQITQDKAAHAVRYRLLLTQDSRMDRDFSGDLQLVLTLMQGGKTVTIVVPEMPTSRNDGANGVSLDGDATQFKLTVRSYKRMEGSLRIPSDASLKAVQAKILERGTLRAQQTVTPA